MTITIPISVKMQESFNSVVKSKSSRFGIFVVGNVLCFYSVYEALYYVAMCNVTGIEEFSLSIPVETMMILMRGHTIRITHRENNTELLESLKLTGEVLCSVIVASEYAAELDQVRDFVGATLDSDKSVVVSDTSIFKNALQLVKPNFKELGIAGVSFDSGYIYTIANAYVSYTKDPFNLSMVLPVSTLKALWEFASNTHTVKISRLQGYNICSYDNLLFAWRRQRSTQRFQEMKLDYIYADMLSIDYLSDVFRLISSEVDSSFIDLGQGSIILNTKLGEYTIPLEIRNFTEESKYAFNYKLFSKLITSLSGTISFNMTEQAIHMSSKGINYIMSISKA